MSTFDKFLTCFPVSENYLNVLKLFVLGGGHWNFQFSDLANFWSMVFFFALENCEFSVLVSSAVCGYSPI